MEIPHRYIATPLRNTLSDIIHDPLHLGGTAAEQMISTKNEWRKMAEDNVQVAKLVSFVNTAKFA